MTTSRGRLPTAPPQLQSDDEPRLVIDRMPGFAWTASQNGTLAAINPRLLAYTGRPVTGRARGRGGPSAWWEHVLHADDIEAWTKAWSLAKETGEPWELEHRIRRSDGTYRWFRTLAQPEREPGGPVHLWYGLDIDIDDQKRREQTLREDEQSLRVFLDTLPAMIWRTRPDGEADYINRRLVERTGVDVSGVVNLKWKRTIIHPDDVENTTRTRAHALATETPWDVVHRIHQANGTYRWHHTRAEPFRDDAGRVVHWYGVDVDVDDRKKAEEALRRSEEELRLLIDALPAMIWRATPDGDPDYANQRLVDYLGTPAAAQSTGWRERWREVVHPEDVDVATRDWAAALATQSPLVGQYRFRRTDGAYRWFRFFAEPLRDSEGQIVHWYGVQVDVDESKRTEDALRATEAKLSRASAVAAVSELAASIAHEINQPLAAVVANAHASQRWLSADRPRIDRAYATLELVIRDAHAAADVVSRIRALFKRTVLTRAPLAINDVIGEVTRLMAHEASTRDVAIAMDLEEGLPHVFADRTQVQEVVANLTRNAIDAMASVDRQSRVLSIRSRRDGTAGVLIEISDRGIGVEDTDRVFEPFFTTKPNGMGMGLAVCRGIVEAHHGRLWATRNDTRGATFSFTLPVALALPP